MTAIRCISALLALAVSAFPQDFKPWAGAAFERSRSRPLLTSEIYPAGPPDQDYGLAVTLVELDGANWTETRVLSHVRRTAAILGACGIALTDVAYVKARAPRRAHDIDAADLHPQAAVPRDVIELSRLVPSAASWPVVFFVGRLLGDDAFARSYRRGDVAPDELPRFPYMNTVWIAYRTHWMERKESEYSTLAHELGHLLCECGHTPDREARHLLNEYKNFLGAKPLEAHCEQFRKSPLVTRLDNPSRTPNRNPQRSKQFVSPR